MNTLSVLEKSIQYIKGVGEARAKLLAKLGIQSVEDVLFHFPRDYEDRTVIKKIVELYDGQPACFKGMVVSRMSESRPRRGMTIQKLIVQDETGGVILTWFNQSYLKESFVSGQWYMFYGNPSKKYGHLEIQNPVFEKLDELRETGKIVPIYPSTASLSQKIIRTVIKTALELVNNQLQEYLPQNVRSHYNLADINYSLSNIHFPKDKESFEYARRRLAFEELLLLQLGLLSIKSSINTDVTGIKFERISEVQDFIDKLPFKLTDAQRKVLVETQNDMESNKPMNRLIQGDVGSGKTVVAGIAMFQAVRNGYQAAMMVPTGILAEQHYNTFENMFKPYGIRTLLVTGSLTQKQKRQVQEVIAAGEADIIIGTHALIEEGINFKKLGLVITDEQHRFGVRQRAVLSSKGKVPDVLVMTATPIPRTLALMLYGDLDISIIDQLPPGRKKIETYWIQEQHRERMNGFIRKQLEQGRQAYIVCPLVEDSEAIDAKSVEKHAEELQTVFKPYKVAFLHGKMKNTMKEQVMEEFVTGDIRVLVSTTVIEVGVNVPNASVMVVENAEKFGLAQLHQLRGRVGRGEAQSYCILISSSNSEIAQQRMSVMQKTNDGFEIAEKDLELRGPGEFFGTMQHGLPDLKIANLFKDIEIMKQSQEAAKKILAEDRELKKPENAGLREQVLKRFAGRANEISFN